MIVRETDRLRLRHVTADDAPFIYELVNDPGWLRFIGDRDIRDLEAARAFIASRFTASYEENEYGLFLTERRADGVPVGISGIVNRDGLDGADLGFALLPAYRGFGYAHEAGTASLDFARDELGLDRILAVTQRDNAASVRVLERLGLRFARTIVLPGDDPEELSLFEGPLTADCSQSASRDAVLDSQPSESLSSSQARSTILEDSSSGSGGR